VKTTTQQTRNKMKFSAITLLALQAITIGFVGVLAEDGAIIQEDAGLVPNAASYSRSNTTTNSCTNSRSNGATYSWSNAATISCTNSRSNTTTYSWSNAATISSTNSRSNGTTYSWSNATTNARSNATTNARSNATTYSFPYPRSYWRVFDRFMC
jgi:hypothetical protein